MVDERIKVGLDAIEALARDGARQLELERLRARRQSLARFDRGLQGRQSDALGVESQARWVPSSSKFMPSWRAVLKAYLCRKAFGRCGCLDHLVAHALAKGGRRDCSGRAPREMLAEDAAAPSLYPSSRPPVELDELDIGKQRRLPAAPSIRIAIVIVRPQRVEPGIVEIVEFVACPDRSG